MNGKIIAKGTFKKCTGLGVTYLVLSILLYLIALPSMITIIGAVVCVIVAVRCGIIASIYFRTTEQEVTVYSNQVVLRTTKRITSHIDMKDITSVEKYGSTGMKLRIGSTAVMVYALENCDEIVNAICELRNQPERVANSESEDVVKELKSYQELLNSGAITQEEYDAKKKQILNL